MKKLHALGALTILLCAAVSPAQTPVPGAKALGIGGSFVAEGDDASSLWGNPAGAVLCTVGCAEVFAAGIATDQNEFARKLRDDFKGGAPLPKLVADLQSFQKVGTGVIGSAAGGVAYAVHGFSIGLGGTAYAGAYPTVDVVNIAPDTFPNNASTITYRGLETREVRIGYAYKISGLTVSAATRYIQGRTYTFSESLFNAGDDPVEISRDALDKNLRRTSRIAFDIGAIYAGPKFRLGIVAQGVNSPSFHVSDGSEIDLPNPVRAGAAVAITSFDGVAVSFDADLKKQDTLVPGLKSRRIAGGLQFYILRIGAFRDLEAVDPHWAYTAGLNVSAKIFSLGLSAAYSSNKRDIGAAAEIRVKL